MKQGDTEYESSETVDKQEIFVANQGLPGKFTSTSPPKGLFSVASPFLPGAVRPQGGLFPPNATSSRFQASDASNLGAFTSGVKNVFSFTSTTVSSGLQVSKDFQSNQIASPILSQQKHPSEVANTFGAQFSEGSFGAASSAVDRSAQNFSRKAQSQGIGSNIESVFKKNNRPTPPKGHFSSKSFGQDRPAPSESITPSAAAKFQGAKFGAENIAKEGSRKRLFLYQRSSSPEGQSATEEVFSKKPYGNPGQNRPSDPRTRPSGIIRRTRLTSSTTPQAVTNAIQCTKVPREHNERDSLRRHFSKFGQVVRVRANLLRSSATIHFSNSEEAALAKEKGKNFYGRTIHIYFYKPRTLSTEKSPHQQETAVAHSVKAPPKVKQMLKRVASTSSQSKPYRSRSLLAKTSAEKLAVLDKIDKLLRAQTVKQFDLSKAMIFIGTCTDMCPEKERYLRLERNLLSSYEMGPNRSMDPTLVVKEYSRSSADQEEALPHELRPSSVLRVTMDYLLTRIMNTIDYEKTAEWYDFIWNRTRAIRKEISIQQLNDAIAIEVTEDCARFHICCAHELCEMDVSNFDPKINNENLEKTMKTVLDMYLDVHLHHPDFQPPHEAEFQSYFILLNINRSSDVLRAVKNMRSKIRYSNEVRTAVSAFSALHSNNYTRFFFVVRQATYLQAALLHRYFNQVRQEAIRIMTKAYTSKPQCHVSVDDVIRTLHFNDIIELESFCASYEINIVDGQVELLRAMDYTADSLTSSCSNEISIKRNGRDLGDVIANGRHTMSEFPPPTSSFDEEGYYIGPHVGLLTSPASSFKSIVSSPSKKAATSSDLSVAEVQVALRQKGITNDVVKFLAKSLFVDVIDEMKQAIAEGEYHAAHSHVISNIVSVEVLNQAVETFLKQIVSNAVLAEKIEIEKKQHEAEEKERRRREEIRKKEEEERKRREEEQKRKEKKECFAKCTTEVSDEINNEVVSILIKETANVIHREARLDHLSATFTDQILNTSVTMLLSDVIFECVIAERKALHAKLSEKLHLKRTKIRWAKWRQQLEKVRLFRLACELFPCTSLSRDIDHQIRALLSDKKRKRLLTESGAPSKLSMEPFSKLLETHQQLHSDVIKLAPVIEVVHYDVLPFNKIFENHIQARDNDALFWKIAVASNAKDEQCVWRTWIYHKFGFLSKRASPIKQTVLHKSSDTDNTVTSSRICVCCKMLGEPKRHTTDVFGTNSLVILISEKDLSDLNSFKMFVDQLLRTIPPTPPIPLLILSCGCQINDNVLNDLKLDAHPAVSSIHTVALKTNDFIRNCNKVKSGIEWLASQSSFTPNLKFSHLRDFIEDQLSRFYISPVYRVFGLRSQQGLSSLDLYFLRDVYNTVLDDLCSCLTDDSLLDVSWPAPELCEWKSKGALTFPNENWNSKEQFPKLQSLFEKLKLPKFPDLHSCDDMDGIGEELSNYCHQVCPHQHHLALSVSRSISSFAGSNEVDDVSNFIHLFPWQRIVDAIASKMFENVMYIEQGNLVVAFFEESLENVKLPPRFASELNDTGFKGLSDDDEISEVGFDPTVNSIVFGACANLEKIVDETKNKENLSDASDWLRSEDVTEVSTNSALTFRDEIQDEINTSQRFERDLESMIDEGSELLQHYFT